ncbi:MAG: hypothetical protein K2X66_16100 [Cyanobacteria bacterium]|nr:hypothetical protein [Cyanobacteriota bacterium]
MSKLIFRRQDEGPGFFFINSVISTHFKVYCNETLLGEVAAAGESVYIVPFGSQSLRVVCSGTLGSRIPFSFHSRTITLGVDPEETRYFLCGYNYNLQKILMYGLGFWMSLLLHIFQLRNLSSHQIHLDFGNPMDYTAFILPTVWMSWMVYSLGSYCWERLLHRGEWMIYLVPQKYVETGNLYTLYQGLQWSIRLVLTGSILLYFIFWGLFLFFPQK